MKLWHGDPIRLRRRSIAIALGVVAATVVLLVALAFWMAIALGDWFGDYVPAAVDALERSAPALLEWADAVLPGAGEVLEKWWRHIITSAP